MARLSSINYTAQNFPYATEPNDQFLKEDVQSLALALETHDHGVGKGLKVAGSGITAPLDLPGAFRATGNSPIFTVGAGLEVYYDPTSAGRGVLQAYDRSASVYKDLTIVGQTISLQRGATRAMLIRADGDINVDGRLLIGGGQTPIYGYGPDGAGTQLVGMQGLTVTPGMTYLAGLQVNGSAAVSTNLTVNGGLAVAGTQTINQSLSIGLDLTVARNVGVGGQLAAGSLASSGYVTAAGDITTSGSVGAYGGNVFFESSRQVMIRWQPAQARLEVPYGNGLWASGLTSAGAIVGQDVYGNRLRCIGTNTNLGAVSGECIAFLNVTPGSMIAQVAINEANGHSKILWVNGSAGGTTGWQQESTRTSKSDIVPLDPAAAVAMVTSADIQAYRYLHRDDLPEVGFLAEEWAAPLPEAVTYDGEALSGLTYGMITPVLYTALKDALARISALEAAQTAPAKEAA
jgi:hypothetical protein